MTSNASHPQSSARVVVHLSGCMSKVLLETILVISAIYSLGKKKKLISCTHNNS